LLAEALNKAGIETRVTREPGGSPGAEEIRKLLLAGDVGRWDAETEALLMVAARRDHVVKTIRPALAAGNWVICDRFLDSTEAYQGFGGGVPRDRLRDLHRLIAGDFLPDLTLILDLPVELGLQRAQTHTRFERKGRDFHERMRSGFLDIGQREQRRCVVIDAREELAAVSEAVKAAVRERLGAPL
jgi:dTMP kinase